MLSAAASPPESEASLLGPAAQGGAGNTPRVSDLAKQGHQREQRTGCRHGSGRAPAAGRRRCAQAQPKVLGSPGGCRSICPCVGGRATAAAAPMPQAAPAVATSSAAPA